MHHSIDIRIVHSAEERSAAYAIRKEVFVNEQKVPIEIEMDDHDESATFVLAFWDGKPVGTARWRSTNKGSKLERFAVLNPYRSKGIGKALVNHLLEIIPRDVPVYLNAQEMVISFYEQFGFVSEDPKFYEAGIPHQKMVLHKAH